MHSKKVDMDAKKSEIVVHSSVKYTQKQPLTPNNA
jgi:hypothetical protein